MCVINFYLLTYLLTLLFCLVDRQMKLPVANRVFVSGDGCPIGKRKCPGSKKKLCIPEYKFCDGVPHCKGGTDENPLYCREFLCV